MKVDDHFIDLKKETAQVILALEDMVMLEKVRAILWDIPVTQEDLEAIDRSREVCKEGKFVDSEAFLKEIEQL